MTRIERGDPRIVDMLKHPDDTIRAGDILWNDSGKVRPASKATGNDHAARAQTVATNFVGVAVTDSDLGERLVPVATDGDYAYPFAGSAPSVLSGVRVAPNGGQPHNQVVETAAANTQVIAKVISAAGGVARVRILSRLNQI